MSNLTQDEVLRNILDGSITELESDQCAQIYYRRLQGCSQLESASFENCEIIYESAFESCSALEVIDAPAVIRLDQATFRNCASLKKVHFEHFKNASSSRELHYLFQNCTKLKVAVTYDCSMYGGDYIFSGDSELEALDFNSYNGRFVGRYSTLQNCTNLATIVIRDSTKVYALANTPTFNGTPFASGKSGGTIYLPKVLYDELGTGSALDYKSATNWSVIDGYGTITWEQLEGSQYENYYVDGTPINSGGGITA